MRLRRWPRGSIFQRPQAPDSECHYAHQPLQLLGIPGNPADPIPLAACCRPSPALRRCDEPHPGRPLIGFFHRRPQGQGGLSQPQWQRLLGICAVTARMPCWSSSRIPPPPSTCSGTCTFPLGNMGSWPASRAASPLRQRRHRSPAPGCRQRCALSWPLYPDRPSPLRVPGRPAPQSGDRGSQCHPLDQQWLTEALASAPHPVTMSVSPPATCPSPSRPDPSRERPCKEGRLSPSSLVLVTLTGRSSG